MRFKSIITNKNNIAIAPMYTINNIIDKNSTRILNKSMIELIKTPIRQNKAFMGLRTSITPVANPKAAVATPIYRVKSHKLQKKAARFRSTSPVIASNVPSPITNIKGRVNQIRFLYLLNIFYRNAGWRKRESNPRIWIMIPTFYH